MLVGGEERDAVAIALDDQRLGSRFFVRAAAVDGDALGLVEREGVERSLTAEVEQVVAAEADRFDAGERKVFPVFRLGAEDEVVGAGVGDATGDEGDLVAGGGDVGCGELRADFAREEGGVAGLVDGDRGVAGHGGDAGHDEDGELGGVAVGGRERGLCCFESGAAALGVCGDGCAVGQGPGRGVKAVVGRILAVEFERAQADGERVERNDGDARLVGPDRGIEFVRRRDFDVGACRAEQGRQRACGIGGDMDAAEGGGLSGAGPHAAQFGQRDAFERGGHAHGGGQDLLRGGRGVGAVWEQAEVGGRGRKLGGDSRGGERVDERARDGWRDGRLRGDAEGRILRGGGSREDGERGDKRNKREADDGSGHGACSLTKDAGSVAQVGTVWGTGREPGWRGMGAGAQRRG